ncbi:MAG: hypothetical protein PHC43_00350 [Candidatus Marinimicrobia bacterium]|nr:hypothetical protein [Candidatus Neomarinimicrobiota bacterium]
MIITREKMTIRKIILKEWMKEEEIIHSTSEEKKRVEYHYDCMQFFGTLPGTNRLPNEIVAVEGESRKPEFSNAIFLSRNEKYNEK